MMSIIFSIIFKIIQEKRNYKLSDVKITREAESFLTKTLITY
jgi:hypothetical protein